TATDVAKRWRPDMANTIGVPYARRCLLGAPVIGAKEASGQGRRAGQSSSLLLPPPRLEKRSKMPAPAREAVSAKPRSTPASGSSDRLQESWYDLAALRISSLKEALESLSRRG